MSLLSKFQGIYAMPKSGSNIGKLMLVVDVEFEEDSNKLSKIKLLDVKTNKKITMNASNVESYKRNGKVVRATRVTHGNSTYLVTVKGLIISLTTNKVMKWADDDIIAQTIRLSAVVANDCR